MKDGRIGIWFSFALVILILNACSVSTLGVRAGTKEDAREGTKDSPQDSTAIFSKVKLDLHSKTNVPLRLPTFLPDAGDKENPLFAILKESNREGYGIELGWVEDCEGGNACHYGTVRGSSAPISENEGVRVPVLLLRGIRGYFIDSSCGAHCDDSAIGWAEGNYHYSISIKAEKKGTLIKVANSAIAAGHGRAPDGHSGSPKASYR